uniref:Small RNA 2'-O-methyltransferase n=1 Tax=Bombyx mori TaxID=7091 RepID=HENMT_BOMMO|nr:RecName: Full=Small RNA 2'-O-methyltransferase; AltName: Full=HEN1 methyltransferase homolog 1; Short=BmHen1 [Bombyx mori]
MIIAIQTLIFFRQSLLTALDRLLRPYFQKFALSLTKSSFESDDDEPDENVFAEYDDEKGVIFFPPMYVQRYAAIVDCLLDERWSGKLDKVVDLGYHDMSFIKYLKEVSGIKSILGVDLETIPLQCSSDLLSCNEYAPKRETPLQISLLQGNAADPDYRLIGCDAVIAIEMIEHMLPHDLERLVHTVFAFIKPWIVIFTTPNDFKDVITGDINICKFNEKYLHRLNCTTLQVKKFSKTTQGLMAKNKVDALVHTREVVEEIKHLTKMLNFNKSGLNQQDEKTHIWYNFNWGENAPYWNQYYKIVREYNYPFETKSDDCRILDLISDEMNRLIDLQYDDILSVDLNKLEIPLQHLMQTVQHITDDVENVRELLEWNGYEVVDDMVIYSRLAIDNVTIDSQIDDWQENESVSDVKKFN